MKNLVSFQAGKSRRVSEELKCIEIYRGENDVFGHIFSSGATSTPAHIRFIVKSNVDEQGIFKRDRRAFKGQLWQI